MEKKYRRERKKEWRTWARRREENSAVDEASHEDDPAPTIDPQPDDQGSAIAPDPGPIKYEAAVEKKEIFHIFTDGSSRRPNFGGCGFAYFDIPTRTWHACGVSLGPGFSAQQAEERGVRIALRYAKDKGMDLVRVYTDCKHIVNHVKRASQGMSAPRAIMMIVEEIQHIDAEVEVLWVKGHSYSEGNRYADVLAREASGKSRDEGMGFGEWIGWKEFRVRSELGLEEVQTAAPKEEGDIQQ